MEKNKKLRPEDLASVFHEEWRQTRKKEDGTFESRWKKIKDEDFVKKIQGQDLPSYVRNNNGVWEIDIANAHFSQLSADWQNENFEAAKVVADIVNGNIKMTIGQIGDKIHNAWLERNSWAKDGELGVPFAQLSKEEQDKDINQYKIALKMRRAVVFGSNNLPIGNLDNAIKFLQKAKKKGKNVAYNFNGQILYSLFDDEDSCYLKVCGKTKQEFYDKNKRANKARENEEGRAEKKEST